jgi:hypothetical protein
MLAAATQPQTVLVTGLSNSEFLARHARPGRIGLSGGITFVDKTICRAQRHLDERAQWSAWSHAFLFEGQRADGQHWVIESDLQVHRKHIQLGVQENRVSKYHNEAFYTCLAVLDFALTEAQVECLLREGLELVANRARYSLRELFGTLIALHRPNMPCQPNLLARKSAMYCSALVQHLFRKAGLDLAPGVDLKNTTPEHIARTALPHMTYLLQRQVAHSKLAALKARLRRGMKARIGQMKRRQVKLAP